MTAKDDWDRERPEDVDTPGDEDLSEEAAALPGHPRLTREIKLGLALIGVLVLVLVVVVYFRTVGQAPEATNATQSPAEVQTEAAGRGAGQPALASPASAGVQPAVVSAKSGPELPGLSPAPQANPGTLPANLPAPSQVAATPAPPAPGFWPAPATETMVGDRYASRMVDDSRMPSRPTAPAAGASDSVWSLDPSAQASPPGAPTALSVPAWENPLRPGMVAPGSDGPVPAAMAIAPPLAATAPPLDSAAPRGQRTYVVQQGDTLYSIARTQLGRATRWVEIYDLNRQQLADQFESPPPGTQLVLPAEAAVPAPGAAPRSASAYPP